MTVLDFKDREHLSSSSLQGIVTRLDARVTPPGPGSSACSLLTCSADGRRDAARMVASGALTGAVMTGR
jgi:hypothetical protein